MGNVIEAKTKIKEVDDGIQRPILNLSNLNLTTEDLVNLIPEIQKELPHLYGLNLMDNVITAIPKEIEALKKLRILTLNNNPLSLRSLLNINTLGDSCLYLFVNNNVKWTHNKIKKEDQSGEFRSIVTAFADTHPDISIEDFETFFLRLSTDQIRGIIEFELPLSELGIGFDENNNLSTELEIGVPLLELLDKIDKIKVANDMSVKESLNLLRTKPEEFLQLIYDFGLAASQMDQIDSKEMRIYIQAEILSKITKENYGGEMEEFDINELTDKDKALAKNSFDKIIQEYKLQQPGAEIRFRDNLEKLTSSLNKKKKSKQKRSKPEGSKSKKPKKGRWSSF